MKGVCDSLRIHWEEVSNSAMTALWPMVHHPSMRVRRYDSKFEHI